MAVAVTLAERLTLALNNYSQLLILVTQIVVAGGKATPAQVDAVVSGAAVGGILTPKTTMSQDGESYDWVGYQRFLTDMMRELPKTIQLVSGPFVVRSRGV